MSVGHVIALCLGSLFVGSTVGCLVAGLCQAAGKRRQADECAECYRANEDVLAEPKRDLDTDEAIAYSGDGGANWINVDMTIRDFLRLPLDERRRILEAQVTPQAVAYYEGQRE